MDHVDGHRGHGFPEHVVLVDLVIGADHQHLLVLWAANRHRCERDRRRRVATHGLGEDAGLRQLGANALAVAAVGDDDHVRRIDQRFDALSDPAQERAAVGS